MADFQPASPVGPADVKALWQRSADAHKGQAGRVVVIGGSAFFRGALVYAARAASQIVDLVYHCALKDRKVVVDADGLTALGGRLDVLGPHVAITPHRGEFRRLAGVEPAPDRVASFAKAHGCIVLAKGPVDIISDGERTRTSHTGNAGMATGGTGDVLSGALAGFAARNDLFPAACVAAFVTGLAGDFVREVRGDYFTAGDVADMLGGAIRQAETD